MKLQTVTLTGADDSVNPAGLIALSKEFPFVEWGILMMGTSVKGINRFPSTLWIKRLVEEVDESVQLCAHLCGIPVFETLIYSDPFHLNSRLNPKFKRVQLNTHGGSLRNLVKTPTFLKTIPRQIIFQCDGVNDSLVNVWASEKLGVPLFDTSSGAGMLPRGGWPKIWENTYCGYAGGLGPKNVVEELDKIGKVTDGMPFWIDMETRIRSKKDSHFDLDLCRQVLESVKPYINS